MEFIIYNGKKEVVQHCTEETTVLAQLTKELFNKYMLKSKDYKQVQYQYDYSDTQKIIFIYKNNYRIVFNGIPTKWGYLDNDKIIYNIFNK